MSQNPASPILDASLGDDALAEAIARQAGELLLRLQSADGADGAALGRLGDAQANALIMRALRHARPQDAILSEEEKDDSARLNSRRVWIVDPLDGTREYGEGRTDWAVHIGLAIDNEAAGGAVALPGLNLVLSSKAPPQTKPANAPLRMLVSRTRPAPEALKAAQRLGADLLPMGSAGAKAMAVVRGEADIYLHSGGQFEWDNCAPAAIAQAAGLHVSRIDGGRLLYNQPNPYLPDLLICRRELAAAVLKSITS